MATVYKHLSVEELEERYVGSQDATTSRHFQVIWLLARGHTISQVSETTAFGEQDGSNNCSPVIMPKGPRLSAMYAPQRRVGNDPETRSSGEVARCVLDEAPA